MRTVSPVSGEMPVANLTTVPSTLFTSPWPAKTPAMHLLPALDEASFCSSCAALPQLEAAFPFPPPFTDEDPSSDEDSGLR